MLKPVRLERMAENIDIFEFTLRDDERATMNGLPRRSWSDPNPRYIAVTR